jgi:hypothetical protein
MVELLEREAEARRAPPPVWKPAPIDKGRSPLPEAPVQVQVADKSADEHGKPSRPAAVARFRASKSSTWRRAPAGPPPHPEQLLEQLLAMLSRRPHGRHRARAVVEAVFFAVPAGVSLGQAQRVLPGIARWVTASRRPWHALGGGAARRAARRVVPWGVRALRAVRPLVAARLEALERRKYAGVS